MNPLGMILASLAGVAALGVVFVVQHALRRRRAARRRLRVHHEPQSIPAVQPEGQPLTREVLLHRDRRLDVNAWDNTPDPEGAVDLDGSADADAESEPRLIDREFLARRGRRD